MNRLLFENYADQVASIVGVQKKELYVKCKSRWLVDGRYMLYYLCHKTPMQITYIQRNMAENGYEVSHSTIIHGIKQAEIKMEKDETWRDCLKKIEECIH
tara:strand:+ start:1022 stop:1321 length:300 start_codon:yes stop_codon:yes gene_type:complete